MGVTPFVFGLNLVVIKVFWSNSKVMVVAAVNKMAEGDFLSSLFIFSIFPKKGARYNKLYTYSRERYGGRVQPPPPI